VLVLWFTAGTGGLPETGTARLRVLGLAQDGGFPHAGCACERCAVAGADASLASGVASLGLIVPGGERERVYLFDATPSVIGQLELLSDERDAPAGGTDRDPVDGVFLTHAHMGHYTGLMYFGFEALHTRRVPVWCTERMAGFVRGSQPWAQLVELENIELRSFEPGELGGAVREVEVADLGGVAVSAVLVPHRDELSDTVGYVIAGPARRVLYVPDTSPWEAWAEPLEEVLVRLEIDVAVLDGCFYSGDELPGRDLSTIGHPLMVDTMARLGGLVEEGRVEVMFTHLNHSNPAILAGPERAAIEARGFRVAGVGEEIGL